jgi:hypothetical protein
MKNELEKIWKEVVVAYFNVLFQHLPGENEKNCGSKNHYFSTSNSKGKSVLLHTMEVPGGGVGIASTLS